MIKNLVLFFLLMLPRQAKGMEGEADEASKLEHTLGTKIARLNLPPIESRDFLSPVSIPRSCRKSTDQETGEKEEEKEKELDKEECFFSPRQKPIELTVQGLLTTIKPDHDENIYGEFTRLPEEIWILIIMHGLEPIDQHFETNSGDKDIQDETNFFHLKEAYSSVLNFRLCCSITGRLIDEAIFSFYVGKLQNIPRQTRIKLAKNNFTRDPLSLPFFLASFLNDANVEDLYAKFHQLKKFVALRCITFDQNALKFRLTHHTKEKGHFKENKQLITIFLVLAKFDLAKQDRSKSETTLVSYDSIIENVLLSSPNHEILDYLINEIKLQNSYTTNEHMRLAFNGDVESLFIKTEHEDSWLFTENNKHFTSLIWAIIGGNETLLNTIFEKIGIERLIEPNQLSQNLLHFAALYADPEHLDYVLCKLQAINEEMKLTVINSQDDNGRTPLINALEQGSEPKVLTLINHGACLEALSYYEFQDHNHDSLMINKLIEFRPRMKNVINEIENNFAHKAHKLSSEDIIACCEEIKRKQITISKHIRNLIGPILLITLYGLLIL